MAAPAHDTRSINNAYDQNVRAPREDRSTAAAPAPQPSLDSELTELGAQMDSLSHEVESLVSALEPVSAITNPPEAAPANPGIMLPVMLDRVRSIRIQATYLQSTLMSARYRLAL